MRNAKDKTQRAVTGGIAALLLTAIAGPAFAQSLFEAHDNLSTVSALFQLDSDGIAPGSGLSLYWQTASHAARETNGDASILLDGESSRLRAEWRHSFNSHWSVSVGLSQWWHARGTLDGFIDSWHAAFGFPDGIRDDVPKGQIQFQYEEGGRTRLDVTRTRRGIGDLTLSTQRRFGGGDWAIAAHLKLPTGSFRNLTGSGGTDFGLNVLWQPEVPDTQGWSWRAGAGAVALGTADIDLPGQSRITWVAHGELRYRINDAIDLGARLQGHGALSDSTLDILGRPALWLVTGGEIRSGDRWRITISVTEDIVVESAPDVSFNLGLHRKF
ncbi:MAG: DUF3187 family protein [Pseudomonadota bacterium]